MEANNVKDMCEALKRLLNLAYEVQDLNSEDGPKTSVPSQFIIDVAKSALAAPPRNCDIYTDIDSAFRACQEDRGYLKSPIDERRSVISFMLSTNTSGEANKYEGEPDESK